MKARIEIKPLSVNEAFTGVRYKTDKYKSFERSCLFLLPKMKVPDGDLQIHYTFGFSSKGSDLDNAVKQTTDILSKKYGFNDNRVYRIIIDKAIVKKGCEFIEVEISSM